MSAVTAFDVYTVDADSIVERLFADARARVCAIVWNLVRFNCVFFFFFFVVKTDDVRERIVNGFFIFFFITRPSKLK